MINWWQILVSMIIVVLCFIGSYLGLMKFSENRRIRISMWLLCPILFLFSLGITILLLFVTDNYFVVIAISAFLWGTSIGSITGILNYKTKLKTPKKLLE